MAITRVGVSTFEASISATITWDLPAGATTGDLCIVVAAFRRAAAVDPTSISAGWTLLGEARTGTGAIGADTGPARLKTWYRVLQPGDTAPQVTGSGTAFGQFGNVVAYRHGAGETWDTPVSLGFVTDSSIDTAHSAAFTPGTQPGAGDVLLVENVANTDAATATSPTVSLTGGTGTVTTLENSGTTVGDDSRFWLLEAAIATGPVTAFTSTATLAATAETSSHAILLSTSLADATATLDLATSTAVAYDLTPQADATVTLDVATVSAWAYDITRVAPTRLYFSSTGAAAATPAIDAAWEVNPGNVRRPLSANVHRNSAFASGSVSETSATVVDAVHRQYVSVETVAVAHTISGTLAYVFSVYEATATGTAAYLQLMAHVVSGDGATVRGTLWAGHTHTTVSAVASDLNAQLPIGIGLKATRYAADLPLTPVAAQVGDRIVIEVGARFTNVTTTSRSATIEVGDPTATADHALSAGVTTQLVPWAEISDDIFVASPDATVTLDLATVPATAYDLTPDAASTATATLDLATVPATAYDFGTAADTAADLDLATVTVTAYDLAPIVGLFQTLDLATVAVTAYDLDPLSVGVVDLGEQPADVLIACLGIVTFDPPVIEPADAEYDPETIGPPSRLHRVDDFVIHVGRGDA